MMDERLKRFAQFLKEKSSIRSAQLRDYGMAHQSIDGKHRPCEVVQDFTPFPWTNERPSKSGFYWLWSEDDGAQLIDRAPVNPKNHDGDDSNRRESRALRGK